MAEIWLATSSEFPELWSDDRHLLPVFERLGHQVSPAIWSDTSIDWSTPDAVVVRSCWDYFHRASDFAAWLDTIRAADTTLLNPPDLISWNMDKHYLGDLGERGVQVPEIAWFEVGEPIPDLASLLSERGFDEVVYKPAISGSALHTWRGSANTVDEDLARLRELTQTRAMMVQPFYPEILEQGEWSIIFFGGVFSHAVKKVPERGDFRVQAEYGGAVLVETPPDELLEQAAEALAAARPHGACTYARVDGVCTEQHGFVLMELELIEPELFLRTNPDAPERLASAILDSIL